ncbi:calcium/calmodulin-dependent (CaMKK) protein kinase kinase Ckk2/Ppk34 [Schizosaccharomyces osmophilus]|uniref:Calcium/calmodulin-dependent (CaMKK) protein kinase kinase Ckk2/Ppk34 n=1 Tax=Schizosaccharomyces osmophilus TaxID=2545709 RepID=A0AAE9WHK0_9SCHI|nr:calcium/calmodulin-dependent (CaMKK) protein kinase kinase Ckk2/Ppk34 [Schizosaccharomyces osmophilus]WBW75087.1 calcium/calmodulin-dependent (CaMKK) protein kinase kinase Ckk2/Ppk34 [Schizosaccharomyces osmophilus]
METEKQINNVEEFLTLPLSDTSPLTEGPDEEEDFGFATNEYFAHSIIGRGSSSTVWLATKSSTNAEYAIKEFRKSLLRRQKRTDLLYGTSKQGERVPLDRVSLEKTLLQDEQADPFCYIRNELNIVQSLNHPNIVKVVEVINNEYMDMLLVVLNYCPNGKLASVDHGISFSAFPEERCRFYFRQLVICVDYIHRENVVHRDIKPDNILLDAARNLCLIDFGLAEFLPADGMVDVVSSTPAFMAPELLLCPHQKVDGRKTDFWSMGVTLYVLAFAKLPFSGFSIAEMITNIKEKDLDIPSHASDNLRNVLKKLLEKDPQLRIDTQELLKDPFVA